MSFDLSPRNKTMPSHRMGAFSWGWMLDAGVGLPIGYGIGFLPGQYVHHTRPDGKSPADNDGARITAAEAKEMAKVARWVADYQDALHSEWEKMLDAERIRIAALQDRNVPVRRDFVEKVRAFADWAEKSGGFRIY